MTKLFCQNTGYYNRKTKTVNGEYLAPTRTQLNVDASKYLLVDGEKYEVGEGFRDIRGRADNDTHLICTKYDILKHSDDGDAINLMLALPCNYFRNKTYRERYKLLLPRTLTGEVDGNNKKIYIENREVYMEGAAAYLLYKSAFKDYVVGVIDIGGNTINCMIYAYGKVQIETIMTLDTGTIKLERDLIDALNTANGWYMQGYELREIIQSGEYNHIIDKVYDKHIDVLRKSLQEKKWNLDRMMLFITGGGANTLNASLKKHFKKVVVSKEGLFDNVRGMWEAESVIFNDRA